MKVELDSTHMSPRLELGGSSQHWCVYLDAWVWPDDQAFPPQILGPVALQIWHILTLIELLILFINTSFLTCMGKSNIGVKV
jgi:hypothetical protein